MKQLCPKCEGLGLVFDPTSLLLTFMLPFALMLERNNGKKDNSITKTKCPTCEGKGYLEY